MSASVRFDEDGARQVLTDATDGSTLQAIRDAAHTAGLDPVASLYNEALALAEEGHFGQAQTRLHVLLGLAPSDGGAHLLLAKVYVAGQQWRRALAALDDAAQCGTPVPPELRAAVVRHLHADDARDETRAVQEAQNDGEVRKLRSEARRLRSEHAHLVTRTRALERSEARWAMVATGTSGVAILFILGRLLFPPAAEPVAAEASEPALTAEVVQPEAAPPEAQAPPVRNADAAALAKATLERSGALANSELEVVVRAGHAELTGTVLKYAQIREAVRLLVLVPGIDEVGHSGVRVLARMQGARHTVASGDTLSKIAWDYYGNETLYTHIVDPNGDVATLKIGQVVTLPPLPEE